MYFKHVNLISNIVMFTVIAAVDSNNGIGKDNRIPWDCPEDMKHFRETTTGGIVIMGKTTYDSIGKPLPNRMNCVISLTMLSPADESNIMVFRDPLSCVKWCQKNRTIITGNENDIPIKKVRDIFVCGGASIYKWFYDNDLVSREIITHIVGDYHCDTYFPNCKTLLKTTTHENILRIKHRSPSNLCNTNCTRDCNGCYRSAIIYTYHINNSEENDVLSLMNDILLNGNDKGDRTGTGTRSLFGRQLRFNLKNNTLPMMTSRPLFVRGLFEELMFFLRGQTDSKILESKNVNVWKGNTTRAFLDSRGLPHYDVGDMGHTYGFSFRHFGAEYKGCTKDYTGQGYDQLTELINGLRNNPDSRRHIISLWEPNHMHNASLPPCMYQYQFYVVNGELSCMLTQRSSDIVTALNWNICAGSILTHILAWYCNLIPGEVIWNGGDIHIYNNLIESAKDQVVRTPRIFPKMFLKNMPNDITLVEFYNLDIIGYNPLPKGNIKIIMNV
jgi:thymidylate synthase